MVHSGAGRGPGEERGALSLTEAPENVSLGLISYLISYPTLHPATVLALSLPAPVLELGMGSVPPKPQG